MTYHSELCRAMSLLSDDGYVFIGQACRDAGTAMSTTLQHLPLDQRVEFPVAENMNVGLCTGISIAGGKPCVILPRINFMLEAISQIVQHLDKIPIYSDYRPHVIIRTAIATDKPLDPGLQHVGNYTQAIAMMLQTVRARELTTAEMIVPFYRDAMECQGSTILVEHLSLYDA